MKGFRRLPLSTHITLITIKIRNENPQSKAANKILFKPPICPICFKTEIRMDFRGS